MRRVAGMTLRGPFCSRWLASSARLFESHAREGQLHLDYVVGFFPSLLITLRSLIPAGLGVTSVGWDAIYSVDRDMSEWFSRFLCNAGSWIVTKRKFVKNRDEEFDSGAYEKCENRIMKSADSPMRDLQTPRLHGCWDRPVTQPCLSARLACITFSKAPV